MSALSPIPISLPSAAWPCPEADYLLKNLPWGVLVLDAAGIVLRLNYQVANWWGLPAAAVQGRPLSQVAPGGLPAAMYAALQQLAAGARLAPQEFFLPHLTQWLAVSSVPLPEGVVVYWQDVTRQKQREQQYQTLVDNTPDTLTRWDQNLRLLYTNKAFANLPDVPLPELLGKTSCEMGLAAAVAGPWQAALRRTFETGQAQEYYYHYATPQGTKHSFARLMPELRDGQVATVLAIARDVTALRLAEQELRAQAHFSGQVANATADLVYVLDLATTHLSYANEPADQLFSQVAGAAYRHAAALFGQLLHPDDYSRYAAQLAACATLPDGEVLAVEVRLQPSPGVYRWHQLRHKVFQRLPDGRVGQVLGTGEDITARKQAETEQLQTLRLLQQAEELAGLGSWAYELASGTMQWSANLCRLFNLAPNTTVGLSQYPELVVAEDRPGAERLVAALQAGATAVEETLRVRVGEVTKTFIVKALLVRDELGHPVQILGVKLDVSEVQRLAAENLALKLNQQKEQLLAILQAQEIERKRLAETLHNGLGQVLYAAKLQLDQLDTPALQAQPALAHARRNADRLLGEALRQTRTLAHELVPASLEKYGLAVALQDICRDLNTPRLHLVCHVWLHEQMLPQSLQIALYRLAQELAHNIVKHAGASQAMLEVELLPGWVVLRAEDNGRGFDPAATSAGLGLRTLHDAVALLGGTVAIDSSPEYGTHIRLRFPLASFSKI